MYLSLQTLEVVEFVKSHPFINAKWALCPGAKERLLGEDNFLQKGGQVVTSCDQLTNCDQL